jgi:hypothetical protein
LWYPGGKLPISVSRSVGQLPIFYNYKASARRGLPTPGFGPTANVSLKFAQGPKLNPYANGLPEEVQRQLAT